jgi:hypothetical protein
VVSSGFGECPECGKQREVRAVTVRVYERRRQMSFSHRMCGECLLGLKWLLRDRATAVTDSLFDHAKAR